MSELSPLEKELQNIVKENMDGALYNSLSGLGTASDAIENTIFTPPTIYYNTLFFDTVIRRSPFANRIVSFFPNMMTQKWGKVTGGRDADRTVIAKLTMQMRKLRKMYRRAYREARINGGCVVLRFVNDGRDAYEPIDWDNVREVKYSRILSRWEAYPDLSDRGTDPRSPDYYVVTSTYVTEDEDLLAYRWHKDRVIRFDGIEITEEGYRWSSGWGDSILLGMLDALKQYPSAIGYSVNMLKSSEVLHLATDLIEQAVTNEENKNKLTSRWETILASMSVLNMVITSRQNEDLDYISRKYNGVADMIEKGRQYLVDVSGMTKAQLYGEHPTGSLNSTGESLSKDQALQISEQQQNQFEDELMTDLQLMQANRFGPTRGDVYQDVAFEWAPLFELTKQQKAELRQKDATTLATLINLTPILGKPVFLPEEIRGLFDGTEYRELGEIVLDDKTYEERIKELEQQAAALPEQKPAGLLPSGEVSGQQAEAAVGSGEQQSRQDDGKPAIYQLNKHGYNIGIQYRPGDMRHGRKLTVAYGHIRGVRGADGMSMDVYLGSDMDSDRVFVVTQLDYNTGEFDENKIMMGFASAEKAEAAFKKNMCAKMFGGISEIGPGDIPRVDSGVVGSYTGAFGGKPEFQTMVPADGPLPDLAEPQLPPTDIVDRNSKPYTKQQSEKIGFVMREFAAGTLRSSSGDVVTDPDQAKAIALSEAGVKMNDDMGLPYQTQSMQDAEADPRIKQFGLEGYNKPKRTPSHPDKSHVVLAKEGETIKLIRFGQQGVSGSPPKEGESKAEAARRKGWKARHAKNIAKGKLSAAYWADRVKWDEADTEPVENFDAYEDLTDEQRYEFDEALRDLDISGPYTKEEVAYTAPSPDAELGVKCFNCAYKAVDSPEAGPMACVLVGGMILGDGVCTEVLIPPKFQIEGPPKVEMKYGEPLTVVQQAFENSGGPVEQRGMDSVENQDKACGGSFIPDDHECTKKTTAKEKIQAVGQSVQDFLNDPVKSSALGVGVYAGIMGSVLAAEAMNKRARQPKAADLSGLQKGFKEAPTRAEARKELTPEQLETELEDYQKRRQNLENKLGKEVSPISAELMKDSKRYGRAGRDVAIAADDALRLDYDFEKDADAKAFVNRRNPERTLGSGALGTVTKMQDGVALKVGSISEDYDINVLMGETGVGPKVFDYGKVGGNSPAEWMTMENIEGFDTLFDIRMRGGADANIANKTAEAIAKMHRSGVSHGDLHLANLGMDANGDMRILDFGFAALDHSKHAFRVMQDLDRASVGGKLFEPGDNDFARVAYQSLQDYNRARQLPFAERRSAMKAAQDTYLNFIKG